jgi:hypothetical protein
MKRLGCIGDIHGDIDRMNLILMQDGWIDDQHKWIAEDSTLVFIGDLADRGKHGIKVIESVMRLETESQDSGGKVVSLLGNHDAMLVAKAMDLSGQRGRRIHDMDYWFNYNGGDVGEAKDLADNSAMFTWLQSRPALYREARTLYQHVDSVLYYTKQSEKTTVSDINEVLHQGMKTMDGAWEIFGQMCEYRYWDQALYRTHEKLVESIEKYMFDMDVDRIVHGHSRHEKNEPLIYLDGKIVNVDGSMSEGYRSHPDRGFVYSNDMLFMYEGQ